MDKTPGRDSSKLLHADLTEKIIGVFFDVYNDLGCGFLETVYENAMSIALGEAGFQVSRQVPIAVWYRGVKIGEFRADLVVDELVLIELKAGSGLDPVFEKQTLNYLRATNLEVALILNFGPTAQFRRLVFANEKKDARSRSASAGIGT